MRDRCTASIHPSGPPARLPFRTPAIGLGRSGSSGRRDPPIRRAVNTALFISLAIAALFFVLVVRGSSPEVAPASAREQADLEIDLARSLDEGRKIDAIKLYRRIHGVGLREAKEAIERLQAEVPATS